MQVTIPPLKANPTAAVNLRRYYETQPYQCTGTELACLIEGRQAVVGDPERWFHLYFPDEPYREGLQALVVGCRNLEAARLAAGASRTQFVAVDQDENALDQIDRFKQHYRLDNLELMWLGADQIPVIDRQFDLVFCPQGPMPPLAPAEFLRLVRDRLTAAGSVVLTVGGHHGRLGLMLFRRLLETAGVDLESADPATIRQWAAVLPPEHPFRKSVAELSEAASDEGLAELLQAGEPAYSIPALGSLLAESGLHLQRFLCQAHYMPQCSGLGPIAKSNNAAAANAVGDGAGPATDGYEEAGPPSFALAELLRGNLREHIVIACRDDRPATSYRVSFAGRAWHDYKPHRNPGLELEGGPFPDGGVARLSWAAHDSPAISLVVDEKRARFFDLMDGSRSIAAIVEAAGLRGVDSQELAREFFHALWLRDYAWFQIPVVPGRAISGNAGTLSDPLPAGTTGTLEKSVVVVDSLAGGSPAAGEPSGWPEDSAAAESSVEAAKAVQTESAVGTENPIPTESHAQGERPAPLEDPTSREGER